MVDRFRPGDDLLRLVFGDLARVGELGEIAAIGLDVFDRLFVGHDHDQTLAPFVRLSDVDRLDPRRFGRQLAIVLVDFARAGQLLRRSDVITESVFGRRHARDFRQVVYKRAHEFGPRCPLFDGPGEVLVHLLSLFLLSEDGRADQQGKNTDRRQTMTNRGRKPHRESSLWFVNRFNEENPPPARIIWVVAPFGKLKGRGKYAICHIKYGIWHMDLSYLASNGSSSRHTVSVIITSPAAFG